MALAAQATSRSLSLCVNWINGDRACRKGGIQIEKDVAWPKGGRSLYFRDPAGNCLEFASPLVWGIAEGNTHSKNP